MATMSTLTPKIKTIRQLEDMTQKLLPNPKKVKNELSKLKEETGETVYNTYTMLHAEKERENIRNRAEESGDSTLLFPDNLPTVRVGARPLTAPGMAAVGQVRSNSPLRPKTVQEQRPSSTDSEKGRKKSAGKAKPWASAFQKIKIVQSISGGIQIEGRSNSRLRKRPPSYKSPEYAYIKPLKRDVKQEHFPDLQAKFWAEKFKELIESWESDDVYKLRLRDILPREPMSDKGINSNAANRMNEFIRNYGMKYKWAFVRSSSPMADDQRKYTRADHVPIRHAELATIKDEMKKRERETELIILKSQAILKEVNSLTRLTKKAYEPTV